MNTFRSNHRVYNQKDAKMQVVALEDDSDKHTFQANLCH